MVTEIEGKIVYTTGGTYPEFIRRYLEGYTIIHYYTEPFMVSDYTKSFEEFLRKENKFAPFNPIIRTETLAENHPFYNKLFRNINVGTMIHKVTITPTVSSNQEAQFVLRDTEW